MAAGNNMGLYLVLAGVAAVGAYFLFNSLKSGPGNAPSGNILSGGISGGLGSGGLNAAGNISLGGGNMSKEDAWALDHAMAPRASDFNSPYAPKGTSLGSGPEPDLKMLPGGGPDTPAPPSDETVDASDLDMEPMNPLEEYQAKEIEKIKAGCCICKTHRGDVRCINYQTGKSKTYKNTQNVSRVRAKCNKGCDDDLQELPIMMKTAKTRGMVNPSSMFTTSKVHYW